MNLNVFNENFDEEDLMERLGGGEGGPRGLRPEIRDCLPTLNFKKDNFRNAGEENRDKLECRICMTDFVEEDELRMLTCMHHFHK